MSAFMCSAKHLTVLAKYAEKHVTTRFPHTQFPLTERDVFDLLHEANLKSVRARYPKYGEQLELEPDASVRVTAYTLIEVIKACHCYTYQACESDEWDSGYSKARSIVEQIERHAVHSLPGYEAAPWGF